MLSPYPMALMAGIYLHTPYCVRKCPYCDFISYVRPGIPHEQYIAALLREAEIRHDEFKDTVFDTIYIGGGTPSLIHPRLIGQLLSSLFDSFFPFNTPAEVSIEANPESASTYWLREIRRAGVNRISLGVQDFSDSGLHALGRPHDAEEAYNAVRAALDTRFDAVSLDLIYGIPGQGLTDLQNTLTTACSLGVQHISCYELTVEPCTRLWDEVNQNRVVMPSEDLLADMTDLVESSLRSSGYRQYEISNFAAPGRECRHNLNYWANGSYMGLGCSAVSYTGTVRSRNVSSIQEYVNLLGSGESAVESHEKLDPEASFRESIILGLRTTGGISCPEMETRFGLNPLKYYGVTLRRLIRQGLIAHDNDMLSLTLRGRRVANSVMSELV